jgi:hypothetical protein
MTNNRFRTGLATCIGACVFLSFSARADLDIPGYDPMNPPAPGTVFNFPGNGRNDCAGEAGKPFANCAIEGSPVIAKYDIDESKWLINKDAWPSLAVPTTEFSVSLNSGVWTWTYNPGPNDPAIKWVVSKRGNGFDVFYLPGYTTGTFAGDAGGQGGGLSHITFYDTQQQVVPLPAAAWLLGSGLIGLFAVGRRRRNGVPAAA